MSGIGSLGLDSTFLRYFRHEWQSVVTDIGAPLELFVIISTAPCCTKKLLCKKYALLKGNKQQTSS